jgi:hypothetical protein
VECQKFGAEFASASAHTPDPCITTPCGHWAGFGTMDMPDMLSELPVAIRTGISALCVLFLAIDLALGIPQRHGFSGFEAVLVLAGMAPWLVGVVESISVGGALLKGGRLRERGADRRIHALTVPWINRIITR